MDIAKRCNCISLQTAVIIIGLISLIGSISLAVAFGLDFQIYAHRSFPSIAEMTLEIFILLAGCFSALMTFGAIRGKPGLMFPWLAIIVSIILINVSISLSLMLVSAVEHEVGYFFSTMGLSTVVIAVEVLFCVIVHNHYKQLVNLKAIARELSPSQSVNHSFTNAMAYHKV